VFTKIYGVNEGFLPSNPRLDRVRRSFTLEVGLVVGVIFGLVGITGFALAATNWRDVRFGHLNPADALRTVIPSATLLVSGFQITLASLFIGILGIRHSDRPVMAVRSYAPADGLIESKNLE